MILLSKGTLKRLAEEKNKQKTGWYKYYAHFAAPHKQVDNLNNYIITVSINDKLVCC